MTELQIIYEKEKTNDNKEAFLQDIINDSKSSLNLSLNENLTEANTIKRNEVKREGDFHFSRDNIEVKPQTQNELKEVWNKSYDMLSKLSSEELIKLYYNLSLIPQYDSLNVFPYEIPKCNSSTASSIMESNALFNIEAELDDPKKKLCCTCKNSNCLKLYCACIRQKGFCGSDCKCKECYNKPEFDEIRNKSIQLLEKKRERAFKSVIIELEDGKKAHAYGCNCSNSNCQKNYCQCFRNKVNCTQICKCNGCANCN